MHLCDFKKIASKTGFTQKERSGMLHLAERTLQRYAKENNTFSVRVTDRILRVWATKNTSPVAYPLIPNCNSL
ncbi:MAG: antitoxin Xre-like helix-turn-helix domain-containing protein [Ginsengibacter sp.]